MKKLFSLILALVLVLGLAAPAFAADDDTTYTITMTSRTGHTYTAYQVFKGSLLTDEATGEDTLGNIDWGEGVDGAALLAALQTTTNEALQVYYDAEGNIIESPTLAVDSESIFADCESAKDVAEILSGFDDDAVFLFEFAEIVAANVVAANGVESTEEDGTIVIEGLAAGYYIVVDTTESVADGETYSDYILEVVKDIQIEAKDGTTVFDKLVKDINDSASTEDSIDTTDTADWDIGDDVPFILRATLASDYFNYETYKLVFHDKLDEGLTFNNDVKVYKVNSDNPDGFEMGESYYTVVTTGLEDDCSFEVRFDDVTLIPATKPGDVFEVRFTAELNEDAVIGGSGNTNEAHITYSNNPNSEQMGKTPVDVVTVFTLELDVNKVDGEGEALKGAGFTLYKMVNSGKTYAMVAQQDPDKYKVGENWVAVGSEVIGADLTTFVWKGLDDGIYKLVETTTPAGYNTAEDVFFEVVVSHTEDAQVGKISSITIYGGTAEAKNNIPILPRDETYDGILWTRGSRIDGGSSGGIIGPVVGPGGETPAANDAVFTATVSTGIISTNVINLPGSVLPSTGGIGTTIFYIVGAILVIGAGVILIAKRRVND